MGVVDRTALKGVTSSTFTAVVVDTGKLLVTRLRSEPLVSSLMSNISSGNLKLLQSGVKQQWLVVCKNIDSKKGQRYTFKNVSVCGVGGWERNFYLATLDSMSYGEFIFNHNITQSQLVTWLSSGLSLRMTKTVITMVIDALGIKIIFY